MSLADSQRTFLVKRKTLVEVTLRGFPGPRAGIEPARIAPLVFETSASTDSAIWAWCLGRFEAPLTETEVVDLLVLSLQRYCNLAKYQILFSDACLAS